MSGTSRAFGEEHFEGDTPSYYVAHEVSIPTQDLREPKDDRRRYRRVKVRLAGRFMRESQHEYPCYTIDVSGGGISIASAVGCDEGEKIVAYFEEIGRVEGVVTRSHEDGFAITLLASSYKREKIVATLTWLLNRHELMGLEARQHERSIPSKPRSLMRLEDGRVLEAHVLDLSLGGARVEVDAVPMIGETIYLGKSRGFVVRVDNNGVAIRFETEQSRQTIKRYFY